MHHMKFDLVVLSKLILPEENHEGRKICRLILTNFFQVMIV